MPIDGHECRLDEVMPQLVEGGGRRAGFDELRSGRVTVSSMAYRPCSRPVSITVSGLISGAVPAPGSKAVHGMVSGIVSKTVYGRSLGSQPSDRDIAC